VTKKEDRFFMSLSSFTFYYKKERRFIRLSFILLDAEVCTLFRTVVALGHLEFTSNQPFFCPRIGYPLSHPVIFSLFI